MSRATQTDLNLANIFIAVVDAGTLSAAAARLRISKSTVTLKIQHLEERMRARLLERTTRSVRVTEMGAVFYQQARKALMLLEQAERAVSELQVRPVGRIRLAAPVEFGQIVLGPALSDYMSRCPEVIVEVELTDRQVDLVNERFDVVLRPGPLENSTLVARKLGLPQHLRFYASPDYLRENGSPNHPQELSLHHCMIMTAKPHPTRWPYKDKQQSHWVDIRPKAAVNSFSILHDMAISGHGIVSLPEILGSRSVRDGQLTSILDEYVPPAVEWFALYSGTRHVAPRIRLLLDTLETHIRRLLQTSA
jgi:DNA-binding transcriptional LysR family regulator